ncbi:hypothetical protein [Klebsiella quasipneumoniae]|uniref:hypothetical protein n=1 Tax=Klebsiella quasipneumoniae TaxID=1463165 RepID=UPI00247743A3|nr:hypothetical protein [Klebsiella quasipneumoniae]GLV20065.1 hypothetical protein KML001_50550 [Klebsiella quasipneumoniae subsp. similipneumoniae]HDT5164353.1 hypothetical protein [Klebsiella quasipneumoniae subsp. similipneumoniae]
MHNPAELNESLERRVELLTEKVLFLEQQVKSLTDSQGREIPPGMAPVSTLAAEFGISTKKAEELAKNTGVMMVKLKAGGFVAPEEKFREVARQVLRSAKRKYGSAYWYHPLLGKFQMSGGIPK